LRLNHDKNRILGSTKDGNLELFEDNIGLRAIATVTDTEVRAKAQQKKLRGWSFGQYVNKDRMEERADGQIPRRHVEDMDIFEISIIDDRRNPCYIGTSIEQRAEGEVIEEQRGDEFRAVTVEERQPIDYSEYENRLSKLKVGK
jgi:phage head maturation protease